jgi:hypothetical protein
MNFKVPTIEQIRKIRSKALEGKSLTLSEREMWNTFMIDEDKKSAMYGAERIISELGGDVISAELIGGMKHEYKELHKDFDVLVKVKDIRPLKNKTFLDIELDNRKVDIFVKDLKGRKLYPIGISPQTTQLKMIRKRKG